MDKQTKRKGVAGVIGVLTGESSLTPVTLTEPREQADPVAPEPTVVQEATQPELVQPKTASKPVKAKAIVVPVLQPLPSLETPPVAAGSNTSLRGRPPGRKAGAPKMKSAIYVNAALMQRYKDRAYAERRGIGEVIERALFDYEERMWGVPPDAREPAQGSN